jgi:hypothetical protein
MLVCASKLKNGGGERAPPYRLTSILPGTIAYAAVMVRGSVQVRLRGFNRSLDIQPALGSRGLGSRREEHERRTALQGSHYRTRERRLGIVDVLDAVS